MKSYFEPIVSLWQQLIEPSAAFKESGQQRQARLLAALLVAIIAMGCSLGVLRLTIEPNAPPAAAPLAGMVAALLLAYTLLRRGAYAVAASITIGSLMVGVYAILLVEPDLGVIQASLLIAIFLSSVLLPLRAIFFTAVLSLMSIALLPVLNPQTNGTLIVDTLNFLLVTSTLIFMATWHRNRLEADRQVEMRHELGERELAEKRLEQARSELEQRVSERTAELSRLNDGLKEQIAAAQRAREELAEEHNLLRTLIDILPDHIFVKDTESRFILGNISMAEAAGSSRPEQLIGKTDFDFYPKDIAEKFHADEKALFQTEKPLLNYEERDANHSGQAFWFLTSKVPLRDSQGQVIGLVGVSRDITERKSQEGELRQAKDELERRVAERTADLSAANSKLQQEVVERQQAEAALAAERNLLRTLIDNLPQNIYIKDAQTRFIMDNIADIHSMGAHSQQEVIGKTDFDFYPQELAEKFYAADMKVIQTGQALINYEEESLNERGERIWLLTHKLPLVDQRGQVIGLIGISANITGRKQAEATVAAERNLLRTLIDNLPQYICVKDSDSRFMVDNIADARAMGAGTPENVVGKTDFDFYPEGMAIKYRASDHQVVASGLPLMNVEEPSTDENGHLIWLSTNKLPLRDAQGNVIGVVCIAINITERKQAEEQLRLSEERYRLVSQTISDYAYSYLVEPDRQIAAEWATDSFSRITGYTVEEIDASGTYSLYHPDDQAMVEKDVKQVIQGQASQGEYRIITKSGELRWLNVYRQPVVDEEHHRVVRFYGVAQDITERKLAEAHKLELALERERLAMVSRFISDVSHDLRTPLATIGTSLYLVKRKLPDNERDLVVRHLDTIQEQVFHLKRQIENLLTIARLEKGTSPYSLRRCLLNSIVQTVVNAQRPTAERKRQVFMCSFDPELPQIRANEDMLKRAVYHLVLNAMNYTAEEGVISVRTWRDAADVILEVEDNGIGIEAHDLAHIFEPLYRADPARQMNTGGMGLGLSLTKMIVESHSGTIQVQSAPGKGSVFTVRLPIALRA